LFVQQEKPVLNSICGGFKQFDSVCELVDTVADYGECESGGEENQESESDDEVWVHGYSELLTGVQVSPSLLRSDLSSFQEIWACRLDPKVGRHELGRVTVWR
jgi:hypothetical protein